MATAAPSSTAAPPPSSAPAPKSSTGKIVAAVVVVIVVAVAGIFAYTYYLKPKSTSPSYAGGFAQGQVVTFTYPGQWECTPGLTTFYPTATAANSVTSCEVGAADQTAVPTQLPEWVLIPAFAGLSIFGVTSLGANGRGFPVFSSSAVLTDCGAGGTSTGCPDHPTYLYSPFFGQVETFVNQTSVSGLPFGVLPTPAHDHVVNTSTTWPNIPWGTIAVLVFDPNIFPNRATGQCTATVASNLSSATGNCLTSLSAIDQAFGTSSSAVVTANSGENNPIWKTLGGPHTQVVIPGALTIAEVNNILNSNLYIWFPVSPGAPPSFPT